MKSCMLFPCHYAQDKMKDYGFTSSTASKNISRHLGTRQAVDSARRGPEVIQRNHVNLRIPTLFPRAVGLLNHTHFPHTPNVILGEEAGKRVNT